MEYWFLFLYRIQKALSKMFPNAPYWRLVFVRPHSLSFILIYPIINQSSIYVVVFFFTILYFILVFERICKYILKCFLRDFYFQNILLDLIFLNLGYRSANHRRLIYRCLSTIASTCSLLSWRVSLNLGQKNSLLVRLIWLFRGWLSPFL